MKNGLLGQGLLAVLTSFLFAGSFVAGKYTTDEMGPLLITLLRYIIASLFLQLLVWQQARQQQTANQLIRHASTTDKVCLFLL
ncbi:MAG: EamA family transporter, partial [Cyanobacteria bacterium J06606_4]